MKSMQELIDNDMELCNYCGFTNYGGESHKGVYCTGGMPTMCEGTWCKESYKNYLEEIEEDVT